MENLGGTIFLNSMGTRARDFLDRLKLALALGQRKVQNTSSLVLSLSIKACYGNSCDWPAGLGCCLLLYQSTKQLLLALYS